MMEKIKIKIYLPIILLIIFSSGCHEVAPIELIDNGDDSKLIEMKAIGNEVDSLSVSSTVDSSGLIGSENSKYFARMIYTGIYFETPNRKDSIIQTEAIFLNKMNPILVNNKVMTYPSIDVGTIAVDADTLVKHQRRIRMMMKDSIIGCLYKFRKDYDFQSNRLHHWYGDGNGAIKPFDIQFTTPSDIKIEKVIPRGIQNGTPLYFKWRCNNPVIDLIISREGGVLQRSWVPVIHLRIRNEKGEITIPTKILEILPTKKYKHFLFTFSSSSQSEQSIEGYPDTVLVQTASLYNILLNELQ